MQTLYSKVRKCIQDYEMIKLHDRVAVGLSGGKDSLALLYALAGLRAFLPQRFELFAVTLDLGFPDMDFSPLAGLCRELEVPFLLKETNIKEVVFDVREEKNPCSLCAKLRRGALHNAAKELGCNKLALGHHYDDAIETFLLSLLYEGRISCFEPVTYLSRKDITVIRPLLYMQEREVVGLTKRYAFPVVENACPADRNSKRFEVKDLVRRLEREYPGFKKRTFGAIKRYPLHGWGMGDGE